MSQKKYGIKYFSILLFLFLPFLAHALPIDWQGTFGVDTTIVTNYRKVSDSSTLTAGDGSQVVGDSGSSESSFQSYLLSLKPIIIINDASTESKSGLVSFQEKSFGATDSKVWPNSEIRPRRRSHSITSFLDRLSGTKSSERITTKRYPR